MRQQNSHVIQKLTSTIYFAQKQCRSKKSSRDKVTFLKTSYVKARLRKQCGVIKNVEFSKEIINLKRIHLTLKRVQNERRKNELTVNP